MAAAFSFTCESSVLAKALRDVRSVVKKREAILVLNNVLIEALDAQVRITATNNDMIAIRTIPAEVRAQGATTVEAAKLADIAGSLTPGSQAQLSMIDGERVLLESGRSRLRFATIPADRFPSPVFGDLVASVQIEAKELARPIGTVRHAASETIASPYLCGVFVRPAGKALEFFAADHFTGRGAECSMPLPEGGGAIPATIMPTAFVDAARSALGDCDGDVLFEFTDRYVRLDFGAFAIATKPIDGQFPDVAKLVRTEQAKTFSVDADDLAGGLHRISLMRTDKDDALKLTIAPGQGLTIKGSAIGTGEEGVEQMPCHYRGDEITVAFRANLLRDALRALDVDEVEFGLTQTVGAPVRLRSAARPEATLVVMPFRL